MNNKLMAKALAKYIALSKENNPTVKIPSTQIELFNAMLAKLKSTGKK